MLLVNIDYIPGRELEPLGLVKGSTIQSKNIGRDITQSFKTLVGGELKSYTDMMDQARRPGHPAHGAGGGGPGGRRRGEHPLLQRLCHAGRRRSDGLRHRRPVQRVIPSHCASKASSFFKLDACH